LAFVDCAVGGWLWNARRLWSRIYAERREQSSRYATSDNIKGRSGSASNRCANDYKHSDRAESNSYHHAWHGHNADGCACHSGDQQS